MQKEVYEIDENGIKKEVYLANLDNFGNIIDLVGFEITEVKGEIIKIDLPQPLPFIKPKWNGSEWVEGELEEEKELREYNQYIESLKPSQQEIQKAQLEIEVLNIINELGVI